MKIIFGLGLVFFSDMPGAVNKYEGIPGISISLFNIILLVWFLLASRASYRNYIPKIS